MRITDSLFDLLFDLLCWTGLFHARTHTCHCTHLINVIWLENFGFWPHKRHQDVWPLSFRMKCSMLFEKHFHDIENATQFISPSTILWFFSWKWSSHGHLFLSFHFNSCRLNATLRPNKLSNEQLIWEYILQFNPFIIFNSHAWSLISVSHFWSLFLFALNNRWSYKFFAISFSFKSLCL